MEDFKIGDIVKCLVTGIEEYGIFVKIGDNYNGLIHISEIAHGFVKDVNEYATINDIIYGRIISIDEDNKLKLSIKDIDYKKTGKVNRIIESPNGFKPLKERLPEWIEEKISSFDSDK